MNNHGQQNKNTRGGFFRVSFFSSKQGVTGSVDILK